MHHFFLFLFHVNSYILELRMEEMIVQKQMEQMYAYDISNSLILTI